MSITKDKNKNCSKKKKLRHHTQRIWVLRYEHSHGVDVSLYRTRAKAEKALDSIAIEWWHEIGPNETMPKSRTARIERYFEVMSDQWGKEFYELQQETVE